MSEKEVVLLSGGLDSATVLAIADSEGYEVHALTVDYGQRHSREIECARFQASACGVVGHKTVSVELPDRQASALTGGVDVPAAKADDKAGDIPATYVPARNTILLSLALSWAESLGATDIFIGATAVDYSGYPDCRQAFIEAFEVLANVATKAAIQDGKSFRIHAPLLRLSKSAIIKRAVELGVDLSRTNSCYDPNDRGEACGQCDSCTLRLKGFGEAEMSDPVSYA